MLKDIVRDEQPLVYEALENVLRTDSISHAYLFTGPSSTPKEEAAFLLAMSLMCPHADGFACESCDTCRRVMEGNHMDLVVIDGSEKVVSKTDVDKLQEEFSHTASEVGSGTRCYIILHAENSSNAAMNSMLKFLEEPAKGVVAILTADNIDCILPTIVSRCTMIPFTKPSEETMMHKAEKAGLDIEDVYFTAHLAGNEKDLADFAQSEAYQKAKQMFRQFLGDTGPFNELLVDYDISYKLSDKKENLHMIEMYLDLINLYAHDIILDRKIGPGWYQKFVSQAKGSKKDYGKLICVVSHQKDLCSKYFDQNLLTAQIHEKLEEFWNELKKRN